MAACIELLEAINVLLNDCSRNYPSADINMAENLTVRLEVAVVSVHRLVDSFDRARGDQVNVERIDNLESLERQLRILQNRWEMLSTRASSCTRIGPVRTLPDTGNDSTPRRVGRPSYNISIPQLEFLRNRMRFRWTQISSMLLVSRATLWRRVRHHESLCSHYSDISDSNLDECIRRIRITARNCGISMMQGHLRSANIYVQRHRVRESMVRTDPVGSSMRWFNTITRRVYSVPGPNSLWHIDGLHCLIRWRFVIHGGIDGFSRLIVFLSCSTNNLASTVLAQFMAAVDRHHWPSEFGQIRVVKTWR